jgi:hypothetical protein
MTIINKGKFFVFFFKVKDKKVKQVLFWEWYQWEGGREGIRKG